jgi:hypothetical protein
MRARFWGWPLRRPGKFQAAAIRDAIRKVTAPGGEVVYAGPQGFARALQLIREKKAVRYVGVIGPVQFDKYGDIAGPFPIVENIEWRSENGGTDFEQKKCRLFRRGCLNE